MISPSRIRLACDIINSENLVDVLTSALPNAWRATDFQFELGIFAAEVWQDVSAVTSILLQVKPFATPTSAALIEKTLAGASLDTAATETNWDLGTAQHGIIAISAAESAIPAADYVLLITMLTAAGKTEVLCKTTFTIQEAGIAATAAPPLNDPTYYTAAQCDARFALSNYLYHANGTQRAPIRLTGTAGALSIVIGDLEDI